MLLIIVGLLVLIVILIGGGPTLAAIVAAPLLVVGATVAFGIPGFVGSMALLLLLPAIIFASAASTAGKDLPKSESEARFRFDKTCPGCGNKVMNAARKCPKCGQKLS